MSAFAVAQHPILGAVTEAREALGAARDLQPVYLAPAEKEAAVAELARLEATAVELRLRITATASDAAEAAVARDTGSWMASVVRADVNVGRADARLADALDRRWTGVAAAMADGLVSADQARVIVRGLDDLPDYIGTDVLRQAEAHLVELAGTHPPRELRRLARHILDVVAPDIADEETAKRLEAEEQQARDRSSVRSRLIEDGWARTTIVHPAGERDRLITYLEAFASPRKNKDAIGGEEDRIPYHRRLGRAFSALLEHLDPHKLPRHGGDITTVMVTIPLEHLQRNLATAGYVGGAIGDLSATEARRLACTANIIPVVLGGKGEILDLGRTRRLFTPPQRKALAYRDKQCRAEGCAVPARWCEAHHLIPWSLGGKTDLDHGILGCSHHHHMLHDSRFSHEILPNGDIRFHRRT